MARAPYALHGALDNSVVVKTVNEILCNMQCSHAKPWALRSNGDLFQRIEDTLKQRGFESIRLSWIKGHATSQHVDEGLITQWQKDQHEITDKVARELAQELHSDELHEYIQIQRKRIEGYKRLTKVIQLMIYRTNKAYYAEVNRRNLFPKIFAPGNIPKQIKTSSLIFTVAPVPFANNNDKLKKLHINTDRSYVVARSWPMHSQYLTSVAQFVHDLEYIDTLENNHGITWLELAMLYEYRGYHHIPAMAFSKDDTSLNTLGTSIKQAMHIFASATRKSINVLSPDTPIPESILGETIRSEQNAIFQSQEVPLHRLYYLGVSNPIQSINMLPLVTADEEEYILKTILSLIGPVDDTTVETLKQGDLKVCTQKINLETEDPVDETNSVPTSTHT